MKNYHSKFNTDLCALLVSLFCGIYLVSLYRLFFGNFRELLPWASVLLFSPYLFSLLLAELLVETRQCKITESGISVKYLFGKEKQILWDQFQEICICFEPLKKRFIPPRFTEQKIICFVLMTAKKNYWGFWDVYSIRSFRKILFIPYSEDVIKELKENCPAEIIDMCNDKIFLDNK